MTARLWQQLGLKDVRLQINSLGDAASRAVYRERLVNYLAQHSPSSTRTAGVACTPTRCACWTARIRHLQALLAERAAAGRRSR